MSLVPIHVEPSNASPYRVGIKVSLRRARLLLGTVAAALLIIGCGSDSPAESAPASLPTGSTSTTAARTVVDTPLVTEPPLAVEPAVTQTEPGTTIAAPPAQLSVGCRRLTDFDTGSGWFIVNDGVMGGRSDGAVEFADSAMRFSGEVVTAGGGFTSVRTQLTDNELAGSDSLVLRVRTDERVYGLTLEDATQTGRRAISHGADLTIDEPADADGWQITEINFDELRPSVFGQRIDAPMFDSDRASQIGIIIGDGVDGAFALEIDWIDACSGE